ncbi:MAG: hypothetical protein Q8K98_10340 [Bacteroidota bacterium]|nr:hypothetical protein [Bacteroidota bacterium]
MTVWKEYKLQDLCVLQRGHDLPRSEMKEGNYPVAGSNNKIGYHSAYTTLENLSKIKFKLPENG